MDGWDTSILAIAAGKPAHISESLSLKSWNDIRVLLQYFNRTYDQGIRFSKSSKLEINKFSFLIGLVIQEKVRKQTDVYLWWQAEHLPLAPLQNLHLPLLYVERSTSTCV